MMVDFETEGILWSIMIRETVCMMSVRNASASLYSCVAGAVVTGSVLPLKPDEADSW